MTDKVSFIRHALVVHLSCIRLYAGHSGHRGRLSTALPLREVKCNVGEANDKPATSTTGETLGGGMEEREGAVGGRDYEWAWPWWVGL